MPLINAGSAYRSITGPPVRFALRVYVPQQDLDAHYAPGIPRALDPFTGGVHEFSEQLARIADTSQSLLPPAREPLWTMPFSTAPAGARRLPGTSPGGAGQVPGASPTHPGDFPVFHPTQRLRRSLRLFTAAENEDSAQLLPLLVPEQEVAEAAKATSSEAFQPVYTREAAYAIPLAWFAAFTPADHVASQHSGHEIHRFIVPADAAAQRTLQAAQIVDDAGRAVSGDTPEDDLPDEARQAAAFAQDLIRLSRWLGSFSAASLVSLDYGSLADRIQPDESPQDMADALDLLHEGDLGSATAALRRIFRRWAPLAQLQQAN
ncbi:hypothetical protein E4P34_09925 [Kocuria rhizophila]|uniref:DUF8083 domain-containing protein n=1 Tax=Kocuria rhizophila TaxID=72000 RepID=A0AAX2S9Q6_KOCRH|nr:hypothetical protein [Kocuria rhizophila]TFH99316.1 hypothetical protein E4P33_10760 [Kocuria rhizophila]TFI05361.1 hypothetical protein E4P34_09925 [Kocuria rhizophila]